MSWYKIVIAATLVLVTFSEIAAQKPAENDQFLYAVIELHQVENSEEYEVDLKASQVIYQKLRIPTKSDKLENGSNNFVSFQITDDAQNMLDEIIINDPLNIEYEYADEQGNLKKTRVPEKSRSLLIRRPISAKATTLRIQSSSNKRSSRSFNFKFR